MNTHVNRGGSVQLGSIRNPECWPSTPPLRLLRSIVIARIATGGFRIELLTLGGRGGGSDASDNASSCDTASDDFGTARICPVNPDEQKILGKLRGVYRATSFAPSDFLPVTLYHYTSSAGLLGIISSHCCPN
jgi:hypothetical protein